MKNKNLKIIAEIGINHNGSLIIAKKLVDKAKLAGADFVKIQNYVPELIVTKKTPKAKYQTKNSNRNENMYEMLKKYHFSFNKTGKLINYCKKKKIKFISSPFDEKSLDYLISKKINIIKVASGEITNYPLLKILAKNRIKLIISTGMSYLKEVNDTINFLKKNGLVKSKIFVLHCTSQYPTKPKNVNLNAMNEIKKKLKVRVGLSDHTTGFEASICAVSMGAQIIEKHITLDKNMIGPDHASSLEPSEFKIFVQALRNTKLIFGSNIKKPNRNEILLAKLVRKRIVAKKKIKKNDIFTQSNITVKRSNIGIDARKFFKILNIKSKKNYNIDEPI